MNRRGFLGALLGAFVADPEELLWVPGKKLISIPPPSAGLYVRLIRAFDVIEYRYINRVDVASFPLSGSAGGGDSIKIFSAIDPLSVAGAEAFMDSFVHDPAARDGAHRAIQRVLRHKQEHFMAGLDYRDNFLPE